MLKNFSIIFIFVLLSFLFVPAAFGQLIAPPPLGNPEREEIPDFVKEKIKKLEVDQLKKDHEEMLKNGELAVKLSQEVDDSYTKSGNLTSADFQKLEKIEKLLKKVRNELGGADGEPEDLPKKPATIRNAVTDLKQSAMGLFEELKKTTRYTISAVAIQSSNNLIEMVRFIRFWKK